MYSARLSIRVFSGVRPCRRTFVTVVKDSGFRIPVIDFAKYRASSSEKEKKETARSIVNAFKESGFIYVAKHGIPLGVYISPVSPSLW